MTINYGDSYVRTPKSHSEDRARPLLMGGLQWLRKERTEEAQLHAGADLLRHGHGEPASAKAAPMRLLHSLLEMWADWYHGSIERQRHALEEDARRLGGKCVWEDLT